MDDDVDGAANLKVKSEIEGIVKSLPMCFFCQIILASLFLMTLQKVYRVTDRKWGNICAAVCQRNCS